MAKIPLVPVITVVIVAASGLAAFLNYKKPTSGVVTSSTTASQNSPSPTVQKEGESSSPASPSIKNYSGQDSGKRSEVELRSQEKAIAEYSKVLSKNSENDQALLDRASCYYASRSYQMAMADYQNVLALPKSTYHQQAMLGQTLCYYSLGQYGLAIHQCRALLKINPKYLKAIEVLGNCYLRQGNYLDAIDAYTSGLRLDHTAGELYFGRSSAYFKNQMPEQALADLIKASKGNPENIEYHLKCATVAKVLGKKDLVKSEAEAALMLSKDNKEATELLQSAH